MEAGPKLRVDKWLWQARFFKTRGRAGEIVGSGALRINGQHVTKPATPVRSGDVLTFPQGRLIRVVRVEALGQRRGPASEAATLYADLSPPPASPEAAPRREAGSGRPTKRERRDLERFTGSS